MRLLLTSIKNSFPVLCNITAGNWALEGCPKMTEKAVGRYFLKDDHLWNGTQNRDHFFAPLSVSITVIENFKFFALVAKAGALLFIGL